MDEALAVQKRIPHEIGGTGFPMVIRPSFTLGGTGGGIAYNPEEFEEICKRGLDLSPTKELLIEESLIGWKEFEMEVVRDKADNCIIVCSIENLDPMGIHTGDSITVAPAQTLTDKEYQLMRNASIAILREIGVETGGSNVQFAINPKDGRMVVIEMNPRVSRSSALASKATGFPIAKVAAKLAVGYTLDELQQRHHRRRDAGELRADASTTSSPRSRASRSRSSREADSRLTTQMKSVGEVMAIGRTFQESFQKALRGLETGIDGLSERSTDREEIVQEIGEAGPERILYVADAFRIGMSAARRSSRRPRSTRGSWRRSRRSSQPSRRSPGARWRACRPPSCASSSARASPTGASPSCSAPTSTRCARSAMRSGVRPVYKRVDTCAAEFATQTAYMYSTYDEECEAEPTDRKKIMVLGGGPNRIGQGIEFDYCCVHAALAMREDGYETIMVNCNPETVSTDYDTSDRLYFEPVTLEDVLEIVDKEKPVGVIVQYGGQTPLKLALDLERAGVPIIGTSPDIDRHRRGPRALPEAAARARPEAAAEPHRAHRGAGARSWRSEIGYPLVVRPSYVLGGRAMEIVHGDKDLERYMREAVKVSEKSPVLLDRFLDDAIEVDVDCISDGREVMIGGIMEHIEQAGIHSGDSACSLPPYSLPTALQDELRRQTALMAKALKVVGLMNVQFAIQGEGDDGGGLRARGQPARVAHRAVRLQGDRPAAGQDRGALHGRADARPSQKGVQRRGDPAVLLGQGSGVPVQQVPRRRPDPRPGDALHRRGDGRRPHLRRGDAEEPARRRLAPADARARSASP